MRILRATKKAPLKGQNLRAYGSLSFRSSSAVGALIRRLQDKGFISSREMTNGGVVLELTASGRAAIRNPAVLDHIVRKPRSKAKVDPELQVDNALYESLRAWRTDEAVKRGVPAYVVFHDKHLRAISAMKPTSPDALLQIKGIGARRVESYGDAVIHIVAKHLAG
jgi:ATP-dependent DNA helicase RecQ